MTKPYLAAFDRGQVPTIVCVNQAKTPLGVDFDALVSALQKYVTQFIVPVWGTPAIVVKGKTVPKGSWAIIFLDNSDVPGALAYHDLTSDGFPLSKVFVKTILSGGDPISIATSHELVEMLIDPAINLCCSGPDPKAMYAYETADPVEETSFTIDGIAMSNFVFPSYFESFRKSGSTQFDQLKLVKKPFQLLAGGYQSIFKGGKWAEVFGSKGKAKRFAKEDRRGHRSESRGQKLKKSRKI